MSLAKPKAKELLAKYGINEPSILVNHLEDLCFELGATVQFQKLEGSDARIVAKEGVGIITINSEETHKERIRFSIGHELGHFLLHCKNFPEFNCDRKNMSEWFSRKNEENKEAEANEFSIELLIPELLAKGQVLSQNPSIESIESIATEFQISLSATAIRYADLSQEAIAVIFFSKNGIKFSRSSKYFEEQSYQIPRGPLDKDSLAFDLIGGRSHIKMMSVAASAWLAVPDWLDEETIMEQSRYFPKYDMGISLLWIKNGPLLRK